MMLFEAPEIVSRALALRGDQTLSVVELQATRALYLVFDSSADAPLAVVQLAPRDAALRLRAILKELHGRLPNLIPESLACGPWRGDEYFHIQSGLAGVPWFTMRRRITSLADWLALRARAVNALGEFRRAVASRPDWQTTVDPAAALLQQLELSKASGLTWSPAVGARIAHAADRLRALGSLRWTFQHGDFCFNNLLVGERSLGLVDFDEFGGTAMPLHDELSLAFSTDDFTAHIADRPGLIDQIAAVTAPALAEHPQFRPALDGFVFHHLLWRINQSDRPGRAAMRGALHDRVERFVHATTTDGDWIPAPPSADTRPAPRVAVVVPCYNEALTIGKVVRDFRRSLPDATVYVYDNNSTDGTATIARNAGALVRREKRQGKGFVVTSMLEEIDADVYVMVDGDDTYPADQVRSLVDPIVRDEADMVVGNRLVEFASSSFPEFHLFGNHLVVNAVNHVFGSHLHDIMSGYRAFGRTFVSHVPIVSKGFELETELTLQALDQDLVVTEVPIRYGTRPAGSHSKLRTYADGFRVVIKIVDILKSYRPLLFFGVIGLALAAVGVALGAVPVVEFVRTRRIDRVPTAILATGLCILSMLSLACGLILDGVNHRVRELAQLVIGSRRMRA